jgi:hypothetical protein
MFALENLYFSINFWWLPMVSFSPPGDSSPVATQGQSVSNVQSIPASAISNITSITSQLERTTMAAKKSIASIEIIADRNSASSKRKKKIDREHKKSDPPPTPQMSPYISHGVRAPDRVKREVLSDDEEESGTQTVWQIQPNDRQPKCDPYQILPDKSIRLVDDTIRYSDGGICWREMLWDGRVIWLERLPDGSTRWFF